MGSWTPYWRIDGVVGEVQVVVVERDDGVEKVIQLTSKSWRGARGRDDVYNSTRLVLVR